MDTKQVKERLEEITCNFCGIEKSVFSKISLDGEKTWDCIKCNAHYFQKMKSGQKNKRAEVIQDYAAMHDDSSMGCIIVFVIQGDIARKTARTLKSARTLIRRNGFNALTTDFISRLWCNSDGSPILSFEAIEEVCTKYAREFTAHNQADQMTQLTFCHQITGNLSKVAMTLLHESINNIVKGNDDLIRYFVAEGQEELILLAVRKAYDKYQSKGNVFGMTLCKSITE